MKKPLNRIAIIITVVIVTGGLVMLGLYGFTRLIYNQRNCTWANIDNIELHAHINIPAITNYDCDYLPVENIKISCFDIDLSKVDINKYIQTNLLTKLPASSDVVFDERLKTKSNFFNVNDSLELYYRIGSYKEESWQILLNSTTGRLCVFIKYKD